MDDTKFDKLFNYLEATRKELRDEIRSNRKDNHKLLTSMDSIEKQLEKDDIEREVAGYQVQRIHDWAVEAGEKIGVEFKPH